MPLANDASAGTERWREIQGIEFCHWDRWLLRLSLEEPEGLRSIRNEFRHRARSPRQTKAVAEAMLAQLVDLEARLATLRRTPLDTLDADERASTWLRDKAFRRVWHATSLRQTAAMLQTPRRVLEARALAGNWATFPVSPSSHFAPLQALYRFGYFDYRAVGLIVMQLDFDVNQMLESSRGSSPNYASRIWTISGAKAHRLRSAVLRGVARYDVEADDP